MIIITTTIIHHHPPHLHHHHHDHECSADRVQQVKEMEALSPDRKLRRRLNDWSSHHLVLVQHGWRINHKIWKSKCWKYFSFLLVWIKQSSAAYLFSSVRSSNSHPDLLLIHHPQFFRYTPVLDLYFLSHYSYIKGNHWTHLLATCIPDGYNRTSLQGGARWCKMVQDGARWCKRVQDSIR